jgi:hypothetical protein
MDKKKLTLIIIVGLVILAIIIIAVLMMKKKPTPDPLDKFMKGKVFLDQNNEHGAVLGQLDNVSPDTCIDACINNSECGGVTWSDKGEGKTVCYLNKPGNYLRDGNPNDYAWFKL